MPVNKKDNIPEHYEAKLKKSFQPTEVLMADLCKRWHLKVLFALEENNNKPMRFSEIRKSSLSSSDKMLSQALNTLKEYGLIHYSEKKESFGYSLTNRGRSLVVVLHQLESWVDEHKADFAIKLKKKKEKENKNSRIPVAISVIPAYSDEDVDNIG